MSLMCFPRYTMFLYIDVVALEFLTAGPRFKVSGRGYQPVLVRPDMIRNSEEREIYAWESLCTVEELDDDSFIRVSSCLVVSWFANLLDIDFWNDAWERIDRSLCDVGLKKEL